MRNVRGCTGRLLGGGGSRFRLTALSLQRFRYCAILSILPQQHIVMIMGFLLKKQTVVIAVKGSCSLHSKP